MFISLAIPVFAQNHSEETQGGRWVPRGTFALSNFPKNSARDQSYARSSEENSRISTFLPGMTIVYRSEPSKTRRGYVDGITHSGIPVQVLDRELSIGKFSDRWGFVA